MSEIRCPLCFASEDGSHADYARTVPPCIRELFKRLEALEAYTVDLAGVDVNPADPSPREAVALDPLDSAPSSL